MSTPRAHEARAAVVWFFVWGVGVAGCGDSPSNHRANLAGAANATNAKPGYAKELAKLDGAIAHGITLASKQPEDSLIRIELVSLTLERAQLTGDYANFHQAQSLLDAIPKVARKSAAFCLATAKLHFTLHRLARADESIRQCASPMDATEQALLQADIDFYRGRYREAEQHYRAMVNTLGLSTHFVRMAQYRVKTGSPNEASALLEAAESRYRGGSPVMRSWFKLQRGLIALERGRFDEALAFYRLADDALPGWWRVEEHIAEVLALLGKTAEARALYNKVIERTNAPEFMDALGAIERAAGNLAQADALHARARAGFEQRLRDFPEASAGHALDHYLASSADAMRALELARANFASRPFGEAAIALARAQIATRHPQTALQLLEQQRAAGWDTAPLHWARASAYRALNKPREAAGAESRALAQNPNCAQMFGALSVGSTSRL